MTTLVTGAILLVLGSSAVAFFALDSGGSLGQSFRAYETRLDRHASFLMLPIDGLTIARVQLVALLVAVATVLATRQVWAFVVSVLLCVGPPFLLWKRHRARVAKLERQLGTWLLLLANALKATPSVGEAVASTTALVPSPFSEEVGLVVKEIRLGVPVDRAIGAFASRVGSSVVSGALLMIVVARQTGGDLSQTLERSSNALRESSRLEGVLRTKTAEGRGQVVVLALVPFLLCAIILWLDRTWFDPMLQHPLGKGVLAGCAFTWTISTVWAHQIVRADL